LYLLRDFGTSIIETIVKRSIEQAKQTSDRRFVRVRAKVMLNPNISEGPAWDMFDMLDAQFWMPGQNDWGPWVIADRPKIEQHERDESAKQKNAALAKAKAIRDQKAEQDRAARTRTWTDAAGKYSVVAEFSGMSSDVVLLRKADGKTIKIPLDKLSDADREWIDARLKKPAK
jgi:hypothetical protein